MNLDLEERDVVYLWEKITAISSLQEVQRTKNKDMIIYYLKSLNKIDFIFNNTDWDLMSITKKDAIEYITIFHSVYNNTVIN